MNKMLFVALSLVVILGPSCAEAFTIQGTVYYSTDPVNDVLMGLCPEMSTYCVLSTHSDSSGHYEFLDVAPGSWKIPYWKQGDASFVNARCSWTAVVDSDVSLDLHLTKLMLINGFQPDSGALHIHEQHPELCWTYPEEATRFSFSLTEAFTDIETEWDLTESCYQVKSELNPAPQFYTGYVSAYDYLGNPVGDGSIQFKFYAPFTISMDPESGPPGTTFQEWGSGFAPNSTATLHFKKPDTTEYPTRDEQVDASGNFQLTYTIPSGTEPGVYSWWAVDGPTSIKSNEVSYTIENTERNPKIFGLFVGVWDEGYAYQATMRADETAESLAEAFKTTFETLGIYGDAKPVTGHVTANGGLTRADVCEEIKKMAAKTESGDIFWLYIGAHGTSFDTGSETTTNAGDEGVLVGFWNSGFAEGIITDDDLFSCLKEIEDDKPGLKKVVFIDACHSGGFWGNNNNDDTGDLEKLKNIALVAAAAEHCGILSLNSCKASFDTHNGHPIFGTALIDGLKLQNGHMKADIYPFDGVLEPKEILAYHHEFNKTRKGIVYEMAFGDPIEFSPDLLNPQLSLSDDFTGNINYRISTPVNYDGTIGTQITITGSGFGAKKGKVLIGGVPVKIASDGWAATAITFEVKKPLPSTSYNIVIKPKEPKGAEPITYPGLFSMMAPEITSVDPGSALPGDPIVLLGNYFGSKKPKVYLEDPVSGKKKNCKVTDWDMIPATGLSTLTFEAPKPSKRFPAGAYQLKVKNKIGIAVAPSDFTID